LAAATEAMMEVKHQKNYIREQKNVSWKGYFKLLFICAAGFLEF